MLPGVILPKISTKDPEEIVKWIAESRRELDLANNEDVDNSEHEPNLAESRCSQMAYGAVVKLKLPELRLPTPKNHYESESSPNKSSRNPGSLALPPVKLTKHVSFNEEVASMNSSAKKSGRLSLDIDRKLSSVGNSINSFEKQYRTLNKSIQDAVRRSTVDSIKNRVTSNAVGDGVDVDNYERFMNTQDPEEPFPMGIGAEGKHMKESPRICPKVFGLDPMKVLDSCDSSSNDSNSDASMRRNFNLPRPRTEGRLKGKKKLNGNITRSLSPIMANLSDKAFLTKIKKKEVVENRNVRQMQSRISAFQQQLDIERKKASLLETNKNKQNYKPRKDTLKLLSNVNQKNKRIELLEFMQANGGKTGTWTTDEHLNFLKISQMYKGDREKIMETAIQNIKNKSAKDVMAHIKWYEQYDSLMTANKTELQKWDTDKRQDRELIYQQTSEGQRNKLENEKRRQDHLQETRLKERQRARAHLSDWKSQREKKKNSPAELNINKLEKEMLDIADKIQSMNHPFKVDLPIEKVKRPTKSTFNSSREILSLASTETEYKYPDKKTSSVTRIDDIKLPRVSIKENNCKIDSSQIDFTSKVNRARNVFGQPLKVKVSVSDQGTPPKNPTPASAPLENIIGTGTQKRFPQTRPGYKTKEITSKLTEETFSHKLHKEAQKLKRMELHSQRGRIPHRGEDDPVWNPPVSIPANKRVPSWKAVR